MNIVSEINRNESLASLCVSLFFFREQWRIPAFIPANLILRGRLFHRDVILPACIYHCDGNRFGSLVDYRSQVELCAGATMNVQSCLWVAKSTNARVYMESGATEENVDTYLVGSGHQVARHCGIFLDINFFKVLKWF